MTKANKDWREIVEGIVADNRGNNGCWFYRDPFERERADWQYVQIRVNGRRVYLHRLVYAAVKGVKLTGLTLLNKCGRKDCMNPAHWHLVSDIESTC